MNVMDYAGSFWITAFNEVAEQLMGISANDLMAHKVRHSSDQDIVRADGTGPRRRHVFREGFPKCDWQDFHLPDDGQTGHVQCQ